MVFGVSVVIVPLYCPRFPLSPAFVLLLRKLSSRSEGRKKMWSVSWDGLNRYGSYWMPTNHILSLTSFFFFFSRVCFSALRLLGMRASRNAAAVAMIGLEHRKGQRFRKELLFLVRFGRRVRVMRYLCVYLGLRPRALSSACVHRVC